MDTATGLTFALVVTAFLLGLRHGIDWDHIVAISDIAATQESKRRGLFVGTLYVIGHAAVVIVLGVAAIALGSTIPGWLDAAAGRIVGVTLVALGMLVLLTLIVERGSFRARSRWMILFELSRKVRARSGDKTTHTHHHVEIESAHHGGDEQEMDGDSMLHAPTHTHEHTHTGEGDYTNKAAIGIGAIHGVGAETPTQVVVFLAAASAGGVAAGLAVLVVFVLGLMVANSAITVGSVFGFSIASARQSVQIVLGIFTAAMSIGIGLLFLTGNDGFLPGFFV